MPQVYKRECDLCKIAYKGFGSNFCSKSCSIKARNKPGRIYNNCTTCGDIFKTFVYYTSKGFGKFCSSKCYGISLKGKCNSPSTQFKKGDTPYNKGVKRLEISKGKHWNWKGGITNEVIKIRRCFEYKQWREMVFQRDKFTCVFCGVVGGKLEADHIKRFSLIIKDNNIKTIDEALRCPELWSIVNGRTLCKKCHKDVTFNKKDRGN